MAFALLDDITLGGLHIRHTAHMCLQNVLVKVQLLTLLYSGLPTATVKVLWRKLAQMLCSVASCSLMTTVVMLL